jgi:hypothetical protein
MYNTLPTLRHQSEPNTTLSIVSHNTDFWTKVYDGAWDEGVRHGAGYCNYSDGSKYSGNWYEGTFHGHGVWRDKCGDSYAGDWIRNIRHGTCSERETAQERLR